jgi:hypothetical protein
MTLAEQRASSSGCPKCKGSGWNRPYGWQWDRHLGWVIQQCGPDYQCADCYGTGLRQPEQK